MSMQYQINQYVSGQVLGYQEWAFQRHQNELPNFTPSPHLGVENVTKTQKI